MLHLFHVSVFPVGVDQSCKFTPVYSAPRLAHPRTPLASTPLHRGPKGEPSQSANSFSIGFEEYLDSEEEEETGNGELMYVHASVCVRVCVCVHLSP